LTNKKARIQYLISLAAFHIKLVEAAGNNILTKFHQTIVHNLVRYQYKYPYHQPERFKQSQRAHEKIMEEIQKAAFDQAKATLTEHHYAFMEIVRKRMLEENLS
jgi:DNA-binding GntR family transcriptional regulator